MQRRRFLIGAGLGGLAATALPLGRLALAQGKPEVSELAMHFGLDPVFAPHIIAMEKGWFREAGFTDVSTKTFAGGAIAGEALVAGEIALWTPGNVPPISMAHTGVPVVILGTNAIATAAEKLVVRKDANVRKPEDLYRIRIGLLQGSTASADLFNLARHYGLDVKRLQAVNMRPPEQLAALKAGSIQGLLCWQPWGYNALQTGDTELIHSGTMSGFEANKGEKVQISFTRSVFVASEEFVRRNPAATDALVAVLLRAQRHVADPANRDEVIASFCAKTKQDETLARAIWDDFVFDPVLDEGYVKDMETLTQFLQDSGRLKSPRHPLDYTYSDPLAKVAPELVKVSGRFKI
ncbi:MAG: ABC transporter substrate-binding protein [Ectothiorhodospiraceae bacterium]|nr:ABC transporter substrate-binding protein [Chromatiales bacterium]MCP5154091.1 ABC transporter substrate-binding protein [Ectothiorhodospiraceae bacterium]